MSIRQGKQIIANTQGTRNYDLLDNKPKIDGVELSGEITLDDLNVQSKLSAGTGIEIVDGVISNTQTKPEWGKITGNIAEQTDLQQELAKAGTPDDITVVKTQENKLQTIGTIEKNKNLPKYDWIGTLAEYTSQNIETLHPDWVCYITDDLSGGTSVYTKNEVNELLDVKTDTDLGNLSSIGQAVLDAKQDIATAVNYDNITNCITEIPQDIKLELVDGTLTLKAGSKMYKPMGFEADGVTKKFEEYVVQTDRKYVSPITYEATLVFFITGIGGLTAISANVIVSGSTIPTTGVIYNTDTNTISFYRDGVLEWTEGTLPFAVVKTSSTGELTSIEHIFNGFGYIGNIIFALPGVKGLAPNGRNADGSLKNTEVICNDISMHSTSSTGTYLVHIKPNISARFAGRDTHFEQNEKPTVSTTYATWYSPVENRLRFTNDKGVTWTDAIGFVHCITINTTTGGAITSFTSKLSFRAIDYNDSSWLSSLGMPNTNYIDLTLGATNTDYIASANGYILLQGQSTASGQQVRLYNRNKDNTANISSTACYATASGQYPAVILPVKKGNYFRVAYDTGGASKFFRLIYAEGEN